MWTWPGIAGTWTAPAASRVRDGIARRIAFLTQGQLWPDTPPPGIAVFTRVDDKVRALAPALARYGLSRLEQL